MEYDGNVPLNKLDYWPERATRGRLLHEIEEAQELMQPVSTFHEWLSHLRFVVEVPESVPGRAYEVIESAGEHESAEPYIAISYRWPPPYAGSPRYSILAPVQSTLGEKAWRPLRAPVDVLKRAFTFARANKIRKVWIDQECINQDDIEDKAQGVQSMHIVYRQSTITLIVLGRHVRTQSDADALEYLCEPSDQGQNELRARIKGDSWWTRAWTAQELGLSTVRQLRYIVGWHIDLDSSGNIWKEVAERCNRGRCAENSQTVPGEWILWSGEIFDLAFMPPLSPYLANGLMANLPQNTAGGTGPINLPAEAAGILQQNGPAIREAAEAADQLTRGMPMSEAIRFLMKKDCLIQSDKLAILGNLGDYEQRIDTNKAVRDRLGFSSCALALALYNGDLSPLFTWQTKGPQREGATYAERAIRPLASWLPGGGMSLEEVSMTSPASQMFQPQTSQGPRAIVLDGKLAVEGLLWDCAPYSGLDIIRDRIREAREMTARLPLLVRGLFELERDDILGAVITLAMKRPLTAPAELSDIIEQLRLWRDGTGEWPATVFEETHLQHTAKPDYPQTLAEICEDIANGKPLFVGSCRSGEDALTCICHGPAETIFSPVTSIRYEFDKSSWEQLFRGDDRRHWSVQEDTVRVPERISSVLRGRLQDGTVASNRVFQVRNVLSITLSPLSSLSGSRMASIRIPPRHLRGEYHWIR